MKNIIIITIILLGACTQGYSQSREKNLEKYWYYRERLRNYVKVSSNYNEPGTNLPAIRISKDGSVIEWGDGNAALQHYISMLATEYKLLKTYNQDYTQTIHELYYAIKSFERLDNTAEKYYRASKQTIPGDLNGFFIRFDITPEFVNKYAIDATNVEDRYFNQSKYGDDLGVNKVIDIDNPNSYLQDTIQGFFNNEMSQDNCWYLMQAFALVVSLVDNEYINGNLVNFKTLARNNVRRIIQNLSNNPKVKIKDYESRFTDFLEDQFKTNWYVTNPATGELTYEGNGLTNKDGSDLSTLFSSYGFSKVAYQILGEHYAYEPSMSDDIFKAMLNAPIPDSYISYEFLTKLVPFGAVIPDHEIWLRGTGYNQLVIDLVPNIPSIQISKHTHKSEEFDEKDSHIRILGVLGNISVGGMNPYELHKAKSILYSEYKLEHLPLLWSVINNDYSNVTDNDLAYIHNMLNKAHKCGPYAWDLENRSGIWSVSSYLVWPEHTYDGHEEFGQFNGLDYMLLHNLYWLASANQNYSTDVLYGQFLDSNSFVYAENSISCYSPIDLENNSLNMHSGNRIYFGAGFKVNVSNGNYFYANTNLNDIVFKKYLTTNYSGCESFTVRNNTINY